MTGADVPADRGAEIARLRRAFDEVASLMALSARWSDAEPPEVGRMLGEALLARLQLDFVLVELAGSDGDQKPGFAGGRESVPEAMAGELRRCLGEHRADWPLRAEADLFGRPVRVAVLPLGPGHAFGTIAAASARPGFPDQAEKLLLDIAGNQALLALQQARLRREERRKVSEFSAVALIDGLPGLVAILGPDGRVERVNRQIEEYCGQTVEELRDWGTNGTVHPEDMPHVARVFGGSIASGMPYVIEQRLRRFDGEYHWFDNRGRPLRDETGAILAWHVLLADIDDRKRAEQAVRASEQELREQAETFPQMLWSATAEGSIDYCNERLLAYSGLTAQAVMDGGWVNLLHPDDRAPTAEIWMRCVATGEPYSVEVRHFNAASGVHRWNLTTASPLLDGEGRIAKWYGACVDIHDRKLAEEALRASERRLAQTIDTIPAYVFSAGPDGSVNYLNPQMREWFGRAEEKIMAAEWVNLTHPDDRDGTVAAWLGAVAAGTPYRREVRFLHNSGEYRWCDNMARPLRDAEGAIVAWHGVVNDIHDRKLAEEALRASERNLQLIVDTIPALAWSARADGTADFFNRHYLDYVGFSLDELRDWQWARVIHPDDLPVVSSAWRQFGADGAGGEVEARLRRHDGSYRWFSFRSHPLRDEQGRVVKWYGVKIDIDERKQATMMLGGERQLLELIASGRSLRDVFGALCAFVEATLADCFCEVRTIDPSGSVFEQCVGPSLPADMLEAIEESPVSEDESPCGIAVSRQAEVIVEDVETDPRWIGMPFRDRLLKHGLKAVRSVPISSRGDRVLGVLSLYPRRPGHMRPDQTDILGRAAHIASIAIERARVEQELRRSEYLLTTSERISETGSYFWDLKRNKLVWSTEMYRIHELDEGLEPVYPNLLTTVHPDDFERIKEATIRAFAGEASPDGGYRLLMPDGRIKYLRTSFRVNRNEEGGLESIGVAQDVTRQRAAEDALDKVRSELAHVTRVMSLGELAASIAHEVNQPLSGIITNASTCLRMLEAASPDIEGAIRTAQRSIRDGNRASEVIKRLRGLYRKQDFNSKPFNLNEAAQEVISICAHDLQRRGISLKSDLDEALPRVIGDRIQLQQVILNLVLNAADALAGVDRGARRIFLESAETAPGVAQFSVRDTGSGIAAADLTRIFDAFFTTKPSGMGIGLSVSRTILDRHGGKLWASANDGPGATFAFSIPCLPVIDGRPREQVGQ